MMMRQRALGSLLARRRYGSNPSVVATKCCRLLSSSGSSTTTDEGDAEEKPQPLVLYVLPDPDDDLYKHQLLPRNVKPVPVVSPEDVAAAVNQRYEHDKKDEQFVGGMGENDPGVWFVDEGYNLYDTLDHYDFIRHCIWKVKQERHGVPFGVYTTGVIDKANNKKDLTKLGVDTFSVSLFAGNPVDYRKAAHRSEKDFGTVCSFIAHAAEQGLAVEAAVKKEYATQARELALSLGAQNVQVYD